MTTENALPEGITAEVGPASAAAAGITKARKPNRAERRQQAAYAQSATWKRLVRNSHKAAVRKLNNEAAFWASFTAAFADGAEFHSKAALAADYLPVWA